MGLDDKEFKTGFWTGKGAQEDDDVQGIISRQPKHAPAEAGYQEEVHEDDTEAQIRALLAKKKGIKDFSTEELLTEIRRRIDA